MYDINYFEESELITRIQVFAIDTMCHFFGVYNPDQKMYLIVLKYIIQIITDLVLLLGTIPLMASIPDKYEIAKKENELKKLKVISDTIDEVAKEKFGINMKVEYSEFRKKLAENKAKEAQRKEEEIMRKNEMSTGISYEELNSFNKKRR